MGDTKIEWSDKVWNPTTGCTKVSTGCKHCYAERLFPRVYGNDTVLYHPNTMNPGTRPRTFTDVKLHPERLEQPLHWKKPCMIFVNSMSDLFHENIPFEFIHKIFSVMAKTKQHTFQILTKRPERMLEYTDKLWGSPLKNIWLGISCENQATADERIPILLQVPAAVRFLSCEPLLSAIDLHEWHGLNMDGTPDYKFGIRCLDWVIVGGESGPGYREMKYWWAKDIIMQCQAVNVPVFMKQMAGKKEIPEDLQIREYPNKKKSGQASPE